MELLELIYGCELAIHRAKSFYVSGKKQGAANELGEMSCIIQDNLKAPDAADEVPEQPNAGKVTEYKAPDTPEHTAPEQPATGATKETTEQSTPAALALDGPEEVTADESPAECADDAKPPRKQDTNQDD